MYASLRLFLLFALSVIAAPLTELDHDSQTIRSRDLDPRSISFVNSTGLIINGLWFENWNPPDNPPRMTIKTFDALPYRNVTHPNNGVDIDKVPGEHLQQSSCRIEFHDLVDKPGNYSATLGPLPNTTTSAYAGRNLPDKTYCNEAWGVTYTPGQNTANGFELTVYHTVSINGAAPVNRAVLLEIPNGIADWNRTGKWLDYPVFPITLDVKPTISRATPDQFFDKYWI